MTIRDLKRGDYFTIKPIEYPNDSQVYVRGDYCREDKRYYCYKYGDTNYERGFKGTKEIYTDFIF